VGKIAAVLALSACSLAAADYPSVEITNGSVRAKLYLPDTKEGYYRATRFDWSGIVASLEYRGNNYFAPWKEGHDPKDHEAISGPVEEYLTDEAWNATKVGATVLKIGVGILRKPDENKYDFSKTYELVNYGQWSVKTANDQAEFIQTLNDAPSGYGYEYHKTVRLAADKPDLILEHSLKNTGAKVIDTRVYDHNFFVIDGQPSGPDFTIRVPFHLTVDHAELKDLVQIRDDEIAYLRVLKPGENAYAELSGFTEDPKDYDIRVENSKTGAGVRVTADRPLAALSFWTAHTTLCPEAFLKMHLEPGAESKWTITYHFYTLPPAKRE
jgi:hypothetical protein